jgi:hypothetical protein
MPIYHTSGTLTDYIESENVELAQAYLREYDMTQFLDDSIKDAVERVQWTLEGDGHEWYVEAVAKRELTKDELRVLAEWVSGQNSDGLGEGFEQQAFAWLEDESPTDNVWSDDYTEGEGHMCSFDWETNDCAFTRIV